MAMFLSPAYPNVVPSSSPAFWSSFLPDFTPTSYYQAPPSSSTHTYANLALFYGIKLQVSTSSRKLPLPTLRSLLFPPDDFIASRIPATSTIASSALQIYLLPQASQESLFSSNMSSRCRNIPQIAQDLLLAQTRQAQPPFHSASRYYFSLDRFNVVLELVGETTVSLSFDDLQLVHCSYVVGT
ncbi:hypothetical protein C8J57DRAFT_1275754 [Mycena rebaudengoi]|nr:hypothetical protein C8J57DRAFT_1275754 [Mycena rebaudengoi]